MFLRRTKSCNPLPLSHRLEAIETGHMSPAAFEKALGVVFFFFLSFFRFFFHPRKGGGFCRDESLPSTRCCCCCCCFWHVVCWQERGYPRPKMIGHKDIASPGRKPTQMVEKNPSEEVHPRFRGQLLGFCVGLCFRS